MEMNRELPKQAEKDPPFKENKTPGKEKGFQRLEIRTRDCQMEKNALND
jgi:hypothetical protein